MRVLLVLLIPLLLGACFMFPTAVDPCPRPPADHPEAWTPIKDGTGEVLGYVCVGK